MIQQTIGNKRYTLTKVLYDYYKNGSEHLYLEIAIEEIDVNEFVIREYNYGLTFAPEEIEYFMSTVQTMQEYVMNKLIELNA